MPYQNKLVNYDDDG